MGKWTKAVKSGIIAGICGVGLCALAKKLKLTSKAADFAHSVEGVPFPGTNLYSFLASRHLRKLYIEVAQEVISATDYECILDIGTACGYLPITIGRTKPNVHVVGIDQSQDMIGIAQINARTTNVGKCVDFAVGDPANLPFPGRYFDLVLSVITLHHWKDPLAVLEEVHHVLKPGGEFWIYDYRKDVPEDIWEQAQEKLPTLLKIPFKVEPLASWKQAYETESFLEMVKKTRFEVISVEPKAFSLYGIELPVFQRIVLRKPEQAHD